MKIYRGIGLMSGSSLDGLDIAYCEFEIDHNRVQKWAILAAATMPFSEVWYARLRDLPLQDAPTFAKTDIYLGYYFGKLVNDFLAEQNIPKQKVDFVASHGHTIFHAPDKQYTIQIASGAAIAETVGIRTISDFRSQDVAAGGQGAPLAPLLDAYLSSEIDFYLNLGGIANIGVRTAQQTIGFDVCYANQILNKLAKELGASYDNLGIWASQGQVAPDLLEQLKALPFFHTKYPKSLSNEWVQTTVYRLFMQSEISIYGKLATAVAHIAWEIGKAVRKVCELEKIQKTSLKMLVTGGGAFNHFLMQQITAQLPQNFEFEPVTPEIIQYKEALLMALMGVLRLEKLPNTPQKATGASRQVIAGALYEV